MNDKANLYPFGIALRASIQHRLSRFQRIAIDDESLRLAAVAIVVVRHPNSGDACFLLTRRPKTLSSHSGQYALPGGKLDPGETVVAAALREVWEEVGLSPGEQAVLGVLDDYPTRSGFRVAPVVLWVEDASGLQINRNEVARLFRIPLTDLAASGIPCLEHVADLEHPILSAPLKTLGHEVYAPTAAMLYQFREVCLFNRNTRVAHFEQPLFAWT